MTAAVEAAAKRAHSAVPLLRGYPDRALRQDGSAAPPATRIAPHVRENYHAVGPSIKVSRSCNLCAGGLGMKQLNDKGRARGPFLRIQNLSLIIRASSEDVITHWMRGAIE